MANRSKQADTAAGATTAAPADFQRSGSANAVGWWDQATAGNVLTGNLIGMFQRKDQLRQEGTSKFFQVQITQPCQVRVGRGSEAVMQQAQAGEIVNVNYGPKTKPWEDFLADIKRGAEYSVWACPAGRKIKITGNRNMHDIDVRHKMVTPPTDVPEFADDDSDADGAAAS